MLELYHWEPNAESLALLICLQEKGLNFTSHYVDMMKLEQHTEAYKAKSPKSIVPLLMDEGETMDAATRGTLRSGLRSPVSGRTLSGTAVGTGRSRPSV